MNKTNETNKTLQTLLALTMLAAAALPARAGEDNWRNRWRQPWPGQETGAEPTPAPEPTGQPVTRDDRITDATTRFDPALYPKTPAAELLFWGFEGAKTDDSKEQDAYCDADVAALGRNVKRAAAGMPAREAARLSVTKKVLVHEETGCEPAGEDQHSGPRRESCSTVTESHCAAVVRSASPRYGILYKTLPLAPTKAACDAGLAAEKARAAVVDAHEIAGPRAEGCVAQVLELVQRAAP